MWGHTGDMVRLILKLDTILACVPAVSGSFLKSIEVYCCKNGKCRADSLRESTVYQRFGGGAHFLGSQRKKTGPRISQEHTS